MTQLSKSQEHVHEPRHCCAFDLFDIKGEDCRAKATLIAQSNEYLCQFAAPIKDGDDQVCFHCGGRLNGMMHALGVGVAYVWGLAHGEAKCSGCGWPARGMHYPKGADGKELWSARNLFLAYHPDVVATNEAVAA